MHEVRGQLVKNLHSQWQCYNAYVNEEVVDKVGTEDDAVDAAKGNIEREACECGMVVMADTGIHPRAMVVHLLDTPGGRKSQK